MFSRTLMVAFIALPCIAAAPVEAQDACSTLRNSVVIAQDSKNTFLGRITSQYDSESIFNEFGNYGSEFSSNSIWNQFSTFGSEFSNDSPSNEFTSRPPMIIKEGRIIGYLSANKSIRGSISPNLLKALCKDAY